MKVKYLLTALALPAMFAACSQEDIVTDVQNQPTELLGKVAGDVDFVLGPQSRLTWDDKNNVNWETEDAFSLFWVGDLGGSETAPLVGTVNALYKKNGGSFTSENIVYEGNHIIVYPADLAHLTNKNIEVNVGALQYDSVGLGKRSIWTTDSLLTIKAPLKTGTPAAGVIYAGGYGEAVPASLQALSSNLVLNLNFGMGNTTKVNIKKVELVSNNNIFSVGGTLKAEDKELSAYNQDVTFVQGTGADYLGLAPVNKVTLQMANGTEVTTADTTYTAQISLLPLVSQSVLASATYAIKVYTNYGTVTIDKAALVKARTGEVYCDATSTETDEAILANVALDLSDEIEYMSIAKADDVTYRGSDQHKVTAYGKKLALDVYVDMKTADIQNMDVYSSEELIAAYATYDLLGKTDNVTYKLHSDGPFELTKAAVDKILANKKVKLDVYTYYNESVAIDSIKLIGAHTAIPQLMNVKDGDNTINFLTNNAHLVLGEEGTWAIDVEAATVANTWLSIVNEGTLTISDSNLTANIKALTKTIENRDSVVISGSVNIPTAYVQVAGATAIPTGAQLTVGTSESMTFNAGKVYVDGYWSVTEGAVENNATVEVSGILNTALTTGKFVNRGTIKAAEGSIVTISDNGYVANTFDGPTANQVVNTIDTDEIGIIELAARNSQVKVAGAQGFIKWTCDVEEYEGKASDTFNYLILNGDLNVKSQGTIEFVEIAEGKAVTLSETMEDNPTTLEPEPSALNLTYIFSMKSSTLVVPVGSDIYYDFQSINKANPNIILGGFYQRTYDNTPTP